MQVYREFDLGGGGTIGHEVHSTIAQRVPAQSARRAAAAAVSAPTRDLPETTQTGSGTSVAVADRGDNGLTCLPTHTSLDSYPRLTVVC